jgi:DDE superfamily endonuclease/Homeodomain-like domain
MSRSSTIHQPRSDQLRKIHRLLETPLQPWQRRRAETLVLHAAGVSAAAVARLLGVHVHTTYTDLHAFQQQGLDSVRQPRRLGAPARLSNAQVQTIWRLAETPPYDLGLPLRALVAGQAPRLPDPAAHPADDQPRAPPPPPQKGGFALRRVQRKLICTDPHRPAILARIRACWRHRPRGGVLLFFDVQPITVKAYGGRRYTKARRLVLPRAQKTRGRFYLFTTYEVNRGRTHWAFYPSKDAARVCQFMRRVRRWYPRAAVWVVMDRDSPHPCKALLTRRVMRSLRLHWITLPKGSPDDNPVETIFSDVQQMILDNSDDPNAPAT